jgi:hypothetical protein
MGDRFLEQLKRKQQAAKSTEAPEPEAPQTPPTDPEVRAEWLQDELTNTREQLAKEREKREQLERRIEAQARPSSLADVLREKQRGKKRTWR